jgi:two-component system phosphate regulon sensor histidine kinase PhoR
MSSRGVPGTPLTIRSALFFAVLYVILIGAVAWLVSSDLEESLTGRWYDRLESRARASVSMLPMDESELGAWVATMSRASGHRFTVIATDGTVLADSHDDPATMENHASRPEVAAALSGETGRARRLSQSTGFDQLYAAVPTGAGMVVRVSGAAEALDTEITLQRRAIILVALISGLIGLALIGWITTRTRSGLKRLSAQTLDLARGRAGGIEPSGVSEVDDVGTAIKELHEEDHARIRRAERVSDTLEVVLGALPQGTILFDEDDVVVYANPSAYQLLGVVPDALTALVPFPFQTAVDNCRRLRSPVTVDAQHGKPVRVLRGIATPFTDDQRVLLVVVDVTERERAASVRRDFVANASHELKTPVASIIAAAEALRMAVERGDRSALRFASRIEAAARHLERLVADLLDLSRLEREQPELEALELEPLIREEVERVRPIAEERGITLKADLAPARVAGSRRDLAIAVRNLLDNALRHTPSGGSVTVELGQDGEAVLTVADTGEGIPTRDLDRVFERFYRVDEARARATGGTGLGLAIVKHVVESHGGEVGAESELGVGSTFTVRLPLLDEERSGSPLA